MDVCGHVLAVVVHAASVQDFHGARQALTRLAQREWSRLEKILADAIYKGDKYLADWIQENFGWEIEVVEREPGSKGFQVIPKRWVVERTIAWLGRSRRLSKDYERRVDSSECMVRLSAIHLLLRRMAPARTRAPFTYHLAA